MQVNRIIPILLYLFVLSMPCYAQRSHPIPIDTIKVNPSLSNFLYKGRKGISIDKAYRLYHKRHLGISDDQCCGDTTFRFWYQEGRYLWVVEYAPKVRTCHIVESFFYESAHDSLFYIVLQRREVIFPAALAISFEQKLDEGKIANLNGATSYFSPGADVLDVEIVTNGSLRSYFFELTREFYLNTEVRALLDILGFFKVYFGFYR